MSWCPWNNLHHSASGEVLAANLALFHQWLHAEGVHKGKKEHAALLLCLLCAFSWALWLWSAQQCLVSQN